MAIGITLGLGALVGGLFTGAASLISGKKNRDASIDSAERTNQANIQMTRETNQTNQAINAANNSTNLQLAREQNQWNLEQWNRENAYNSPANQRELLKAGGFNPAMLGGQFTPSQQLVSADLANQNAVYNNAPNIQDPSQQGIALQHQSQQNGLAQMANAIENGVRVAKGVKEIQKTESDIDRNSVANKLDMEHLKNFAQNTKYLAAHTDRIEKLTPLEIFQYQMQQELLDQRITLGKYQISEEEWKVGNRELIRDAMNLKYKLLQKEFEYVDRFKMSQLKLWASQAWNFATNAQLNNQEYLFRIANGGMSPSDVAMLSATESTNRTSRHNVSMQRLTTERGQDLQYKAAKYNTDSNSMDKYVKFGMNALAIGAATYLGIGGKKKFLQMLPALIKSIKKPSLGGKVGIPFN